MIERGNHPRPDFYRQNWVSLNGTWQFSFDEAEKGLSEKWYLPQTELHQTIEVPFCYQSARSGIGLEKQIDVVWYRCKFTVPASFAKKRTVLCFGAVDYFARVYVNGSFIGSHEGGYSPFRMDITDYLTDGENDLCLYVEDRPDRRQPRGKQYWLDGWKRCWYVPCTGIWQSVWLEAAGETAIEKILVTPDIDNGEMKAEIILNGKPADDMTLAVEVLDGEKTFKKLTVRPDSACTRVTVSMLDPVGIEDIHLWTPKDPMLYDLRVTLTDGKETLDEVTTYFGMRKIEVRDGYILLNNRAVYLRMVLDQGYWPDSLMTAPDDDALRADVEWTLKLGYNGARKHQKVEDPRYYYWADRLGLLVWGEIPAAFEFTGKAVRNTAETMWDMIERDMNHPSVIAWVPVNESWGMTRMYDNAQMQSAARMLYHACKALDPTRIVSTNDGWETVETDILGLHDYTAKGKDLLFHFDDRVRRENYAVDSRMSCSTGYRPAGGEALMVTEYGGIAMDNTGSGWGYNGKVKDEEEYLSRFKDATDGIRAIRDCRGYCYTQLTDVRQEINGVLRADRTPKVDVEQFRACNVNPDGER